MNARRYTLHAITQEGVKALIIVSDDIDELREIAYAMRLPNTQIRVYDRWRKLYVK